MKHVAMNSFLPSPPNQSSIRRNYTKASHCCALSSSQFFSVKPRTSFRNPTLSTENQNHNANMLKRVVLEGSVFVLSKLRILRYFQF